MKKIFRIMCAAAVCAGCIAEQEQMSSVSEVCSGLVLVGDTGAAQTKIEIGELSGNNFPVYWASGDAIGVFGLHDNADMNNVHAILRSEGGKTSGDFSLTEAYELPSGENDLFIYYPYSSHPLISGDVVAVEVPSRQKAPSTSVMNYVGQNVVGYAWTKSIEGQKAGFVMNYANAFVKLTISSTEYASYKLKSVTLCDLGKKINLSGYIGMNSLTREACSAYDGESSVRLDIENPTSLASAQTVWMTSLPADFTSTPLYIVLELYNETTGETATIPVAKNGVLERGKVNAINVIDFKAADMAFDWYEPVEKRDLVGGWAYGPQNTYLLQQNKADYGYYINVKARGDLSKVEKPAYYGLYTASAEGNFSDNASSQMLCYINNDKTNYTYDPDKLVPVPSNYEIRINLFGKDAKILHPDGVTEKKPEGRWAVVALYNAKKEIIWSYMIWRYQSGDDKPVDVDYGSFKLLDRALGADRHYASRSTETSSAEYKKQIANCHAYFQWGRKDPLPWSNGCQVNYKRAAAPVDIAGSIAAPGKYFYDTETSGLDWKSDDHSANLWGAESGLKTIYDPCPEGYRVPDQSVLQYLTQSANARIIKSTDSDSPFKGKNTVVAVDINKDGDYDDYWPFAGGLLHGYYKETWGGEGARTATNSTAAAKYWSNKAETAIGDSWKSFLLSSEGELPIWTNDVRVNAYAIRCQKEE